MYDQSELVHVHSSRLKVMRNTYMAMEDDGHNKQESRGGGKGDETVETRAKMGTAVDGALKASLSQSARLCTLARCLCVLWHYCVLNHTKGRRHDVCVKRLFREHS